MNNYLKCILLIALCIPSSLITAQTGAQFIDLGSGGAAKVSNNGIYVCGNNYPAPGFLWTEAGGRITLGTGYTEAMAVSNDGIVSGSYRDENLPDPYGILHSEAVFIRIISGTLYPVTQATLSLIFIFYLC